MIVKNEEDWIEGAIESVRTLTDEVIIVDTGSTDSTINKVQRFSPKVIPFKWIDDFAAARNVSLAAATRPWILVLDADERIAKRDLPILMSAMQGNEDGFHLIQRNYVPLSNVIGWSANNGDYEEGSPYPGYVDNPLIRLFRNSPAIRFSYPVHEIIDPTRMSSPERFGRLPVPIHHYGKVLGRERLARKQRLYLSIGLKKIEQHPKNWKNHFEVGVQYQELQRHDEACQYFERAWQLSKMPYMLHFWAVSEKRQGNLTRAAELVERAIHASPNSHELHLELGNVYQALGELDKALAEYQRTLKIQPASSIAVFNCGLVYRQKGDLVQAERFYRLALQLEPAFREPALELAGLQMAAGVLDEALDLLMPILEADPNCREARLGLAKYYVQSQKSSDALRVLGDLQQKDPVAQCIAGAAFLQDDKLDQAQRILESALKQDRTLIDARMNLAEVYSRKGEHARAARYLVSAREQMATVRINAL